MTEGIEEGAVCSRQYVSLGFASEALDHISVSYPCVGVLVYPAVKDCYCHISPPCGSCVGNPLTCPVCGWQEE